MFWKVLFWITLGLLFVSVIASGMAVAGGGVMCTIDLGIWAACFKFATSMLFLRIAAPLILVAGAAKVITEIRKKTP